VTKAEATEPDQRRAAGAAPAAGLGRPSEDLAEADYRALAEFRHTIRQFLDASERMALARGITPQQHQLMLAIAGRPPAAVPTVGYLAERLLIRPHSAVGLVNRLVDAGLVERAAGETDRRQILVRLTPQGESMLRELSAAHRQELRSLEPRLVQALGAIVATREGQS
jgi:DNA-binding MarR family transcriptional regulator